MIRTGALVAALVGTLGFAGAGQGAAAPTPGSTVATATNDEPDLPPCTVYPPLNLRVDALVKVYPQRYGADCDAPGPTWATFRARWDVVLPDGYPSIFYDFDLDGAPIAFEDGRTPLGRVIIRPAGQSVHTITEPYREESFFPGNLNTVTTYWKRGSRATLEVSRRGQDVTFLIKARYWDVRSHVWMPFTHMPASLQYVDSRGAWRTLRTNKTGSTSGNVSYTLRIPLTHTYRVSVPALATVWEVTTAQTTL